MQRLVSLCYIYIYILYYTALSLRVWYVRQAVYCLKEFFARSYRNLELESIDVLYLDNAAEYQLSVIVGPARCLLVSAVELTYTHTVLWGKTLSRNERKSDGVLLS